MQRGEHNSSMKDQDLRKLQQELTDNILKVSIMENRLEMAQKVGVFASLLTWSDLVIDLSQFPQSTLTHKHCIGTLF